MKMPAPKEGSTPFGYSQGTQTIRVDEVLEISPATVKRNWNVAKAWLARELKRN